MVLNQKELSFNVEPIYIPKTISEFFGEISSICNVSEKLLKIHDFIERLEEEMRKIDAFKRELPITLLLISDAIFALKEEVIQCKKTNLEPVLEEFIPLKRTGDEAENNEAEKEKDKENRDKKNWMSSVQLWNHSDNGSPEFNHNPKQTRAVESNKEFALENVGMVDHIYAPCANEGRVLPVVVTKTEDKEESHVGRLSLFTTGTSCPSEGLGSSVLSSKTSSSRAVSSSSPNVQSILRTTFHPLQQQSSRKQRRCWSQDLHRRFVCALQQLGGSQATPKQIREHMQVDGLTNDEVKSHLQKYRLHTRKLPVPAAVTLNSKNPGTLSLGAALWMSGNQYGESPKLNQSQSSSPQGPLQLTETTGGTSTRTDSMDDDEDDKSESFGCKFRIHTSA